MDTREKVGEVLRLMDIRHFNSASTVRTSLGFVKTLFRGNRDNSTLSKKGLQGIFNYFPLSERLVTSGQPEPGHFPLIQAEGFNKIINLAPHNAENALPNEAELVHELGMEYVHIPVAFDNPTEEDFQRFCQEVSDPGKVFVHCAANMRVSAFIYRYRIEVLGEDPQPARADLNKLWKPFGVWSTFIGD